MNLRDSRAPAAPAAFDRSRSTGRAFLLTLIALLLFVTGSAIAQAPGPLEVDLEEGMAGPDAFARELMAAEGARLQAPLETWRLDDGRSVSVTWDFTSSTPFEPVIEVPEPGGQSWYLGSRIIPGPRAKLTADGLTTENETPEEPIASAEDTNPTLEEVKTTTISYWWRHTDGTTAPPGPTLQIDPPDARIVSIDEWPSQLYPGWMFTQVVVRFGPPCPASVKATLFQPPGAKPVVIKSLVLSSTCGDSSTDPTDPTDPTEPTESGPGPEALFDSSDGDEDPYSTEEETVFWDGDASGGDPADKTYCVYSIFSTTGNCGRFAVGDKLCIDCPANNQCPGPLGGQRSRFRYVRADGTTICTGTWVKHYDPFDPNACIRCSNGQTGYVFVD